MNMTLFQRGTMALVFFSTAANAAFANEPSAFAGARFQQVIGSGGVPLNVVSKGDPSKPAVLFVHGFRQSYLSWSAQFASSLSERCYLVAFDLRGHGNSGQPWLAEAYDNSLPWAEDVAQVMVATKLQRPLVVAWSFGGNVMADYLHHYPASTFSRLVLTGTAAGTLAAPAPPKDAPPPPSTSADLEVNLQSLERSMNLLFPQLAPDSPLRRKFAAAAMRVSPAVDRAVMRRPRKAEPLPLSEITFINGAKDPLVGPAITAKLRDFFPKATFIEFAESGHAPFLDNPERFNHIIDELQCATSAAKPQ